MYRKPTRGWTKHIDFIILDVICLQLAFVLAYWYRFGGGVNPYHKTLYRSIIFVMTLIDILVALSFNSYSGVLKRGWFAQLLASGKHSFIVLATVTIYLFSTKTGDDYSRLTIGLAAVLHFVITYIVSLIYRAIRWSKTTKERSMFVISTAAEVEQAIDNILLDRSIVYSVLGVAILDQNMTGSLIKGLPVVANRNTIDEFICRGWVDEVYVRLPQDDSINESLYRSLREMGVTIHIDATAYQSLSGCDFVMEQIGRRPVLTTSIRMTPVWQLTLKRLTDILGGVVGCIITAIIAILLAPFIWAKSPGPLFFSQERIGMNGKRFRIFKFRSMYLDAEARKAALIRTSGLENQMMFKLDDDPRIIGSEKKDKKGRPRGIGNFIRDTSLDEFPQFWNVLKGEMSLVGTRPPTVDEWERYDLHHRVRMSTKPGITGMWQVSGRSEIVDFEEVVRLDREYIENWSIGLDIRILFKTIWVVLTKKGAK